MGLSDENGSALTSLRLGAGGTRRDSISDSAAMPAPAKNTAAGEAIHRSPNVTGITTAAMWLMVKATPAVGAMSAGSAIFWK